MSDRPSGGDGMGVVSEGDKGMCSNRLLNILESPQLGPGLSLVGPHLSRPGVRLSLSLLWGWLQLAAGWVPRPPPMRDVGPSCRLAAMWLP